MRQQFAFHEVVSCAIKSFWLENNKFLLHSSCDLCPMNESVDVKCVPSHYYHYIVIIVISISTISQVLSQII